MYIDDFAHIVLITVGSEYVIHLHEDEDIHGIIVLAECAWDEAVVVRVHHGRVEDPVNLRTNTHASGECNAGKERRFDFFRGERGNERSMLTLIIPVFLSSSYLTLLPLVISTTTLNTAGAPGPASTDQIDMREGISIRPWPMMSTNSIRLEDLQRNGMDPLTYRSRDRAMGGRRRTSGRARRGSAR